MISRCLLLPNPKACWTHTDFLVFVPRLVFAVSSVTPRHVSLRLYDAQKNAVRFLWASPPGLLRPHEAAGSRPVVRRHAHPSRFRGAPGRVSALWQREARAVGVAGRQPAVHQAVRFLRRPALPRYHDPGGGRGTSPRLARGQGAGKAVHGSSLLRAWARPPAGDRHRRNLHRQRAQVPHRGQRLDARPADLVRRQGPLRGEHGRVLRVARPEKSPRIRLAVMDMWKAFRNSTEAHAPQAAILYDKFHSCNTWARPWTRSARGVRPAPGQRAPVHQGAEVHLAVALGQPHHRREKALKMLLWPTAAQQGLPAQGVVRSAVGLRARLGAAVLRQLARCLKWQRLKPREIR